MVGKIPHTDCTAVPAAPAAAAANVPAFTWMSKPGERAAGLAFSVCVSIYLYFYVSLLLARKKREDFRSLAVWKGDDDYFLYMKFLCYRSFPRNPTCKTHIYP